MFDELDDPAPELRPTQLLPQVQARAGVLRRRRRALAAGGAGTALALVGAIVLGLPSGERRTDSLLATQPSAPPTSAPTRTTEPTTAPTSAPTSDPTTGPTSEPTSVPVLPPPADEEQPGPTAPPVSPAPTQEPSAGPPAPSGREVELRGDDLAVTQIGAPRAQAVAAVTAALGPPSEDPSSSTRCPASVREVVWPGFTLAFDEQDRLAGWTSQSPSLRTPSGVTVGTTVARLREVYGDRLQLFPPNPDHGDTYGVEGVSMIGGLSGPGDGDRVRSLSNGDCTGP